METGWRRATFPASRQLTQPLSSSSPGSGTSAEATVNAVTTRVKGLFNQAANSITRAASTLGDKVKTLAHVEEMNAPSLGSTTMHQAVKKEPSLLYKEEHAQVKVFNREQTVGYSRKLPITVSYSYGSNDDSSLAEAETQLDLSNTGSEYTVKVEQVLEDSLVAIEEEKRVPLEILPQPESLDDVISDSFTTPGRLPSLNVSHNEDESGNIFNGVHHARRRPMSYYLLPVCESKASPSSSIASSPGSMSNSSPSSSAAELSWDQYDMCLIPTPDRNAAPDSPVVIQVGRRSVGGVDGGKAGKKRISLAPCLKTLKLSPLNCTPSSLAGNSSVSSIGSPIEPLEERCSSPTRKLLKTMKVRKSLSSSAVETKSRGTIDVYIKYPAQHTMSLDAAKERRQRYNSMSDEGLMKLLSDRDSEIDDLKEYVNGLLIHVLENCPERL